MYIFELKYCNAYRNRSGGLHFSVDGKILHKWHLVSTDNKESDLELLQLIALTSCGCTEYLDRLPFDLAMLIHDHARPLQLELIWAEHRAGGNLISEKHRTQSGIKINARGKGERLYKKEYRLLHEKFPAARFSLWSHPARNPVFAYGAVPLAHAGSDDFDFTDPYYQLRRVHSLFSEKALLTDPEAFLNNLHYRGVGRRRHMPEQILKNLQGLLQRHFHADTREWMDKNADLEQHWARLSSLQQVLLLPVIDGARHLHDALPSYANPLQFPGIMLLDRPDKYCPPEYFADWINLLDQLFPAMQFIVSVPAAQKYLWPVEVLSKKLPCFPPVTAKLAGNSVNSCDFVNSSNTVKSGNTGSFAQSPNAVNPGNSPSSSGTSPLHPGVASLPAGTILLVDVDSSFPNLALMKLAAYYEQQGHPVRLVKREAYLPGAEAVFASSVFNYPFSKRRLQKMQAYYGDLFHSGGSGIDIKKRLPRKIEDAEPDYSIYPKLQDRAIGFLTRGCPFQCPFCLVPLKEGKPRQVNDLNSLTGPKRKKLILLDDNILAHPNSYELLQAMAAKKLQVNFNQTLDLNLADEHSARLIKGINCSNFVFTRTVYHFSLNDNRNLPELRKKYNLFNFGAGDNVEFICMYGFNTTLAQDLERFRFLRSLPGAYVFVQEYQPFLGGPEPQLDNYFDDRVQTDRYLDELIEICFPQNMKSMEKYYRWVSRLYAERFGTLHMGLVETIFRYNKRFNRGRYIASLAGTKDFF